jgi:hypothetical protein
VEAAAANTGRSKHDEIVDEEEVNESRSGGDNGKRALAWNYFKLQSQKHHKNKEGDLQFTSSGAKIMKMKMECTLPKAGCMEMWVTKFGSKSLQSIVSPVIKLISQSNANKKSCSRFH